MPSLESVRAAYDAGLSQRDVSDALDVPLQFVRIATERRRDRHETLRLTVRRRNQHRAERAHEVYAETNSFRAVGRALGCTHVTAARLIREYPASP